MSQGTLRGIEAEISLQLERELSPKFKERIGGVGTLVPASAFIPPGIQSRDLSTVSSPALIGLRVERLSGALAWSAVARSGATILGPFSADNLRIYFEKALPSVSWTAEGSAVSPADFTLSSVTLSPHRVTSQCYVSKQLLQQAAGTPSFDIYLSTKLGQALSGAVDNAVLYGGGTAANQPTGIINTSGCTLVTTGVPPAWADMEALRLASTNQAADLSSFGYIVSQAVRKSLATTARFSGGGSSIWDVAGRESEVSLQVSDNRIFACCWNYATICYWGIGENSPVVDLVVDGFSRAQFSETVFTATIYADCCLRWPELGAFSQSGVAT